MPKPKYTLEDFKRDVLEALNAEPEGNQVGQRKSNALEMLKAQAKLGKKR